MTGEEAIKILEINSICSPKATEFKKAVEIAKNAIKKQIPKKVNIQRYMDTKCDCGYEFSKHYGDGYYDIPFENKTKYCPDCGQALDWGDNE